LCGIAGCFGETADRQLILKMLEPIRHRGRDDQGVFTDGGIGLGCNRLAIIDVPGGHQPISNAEGTVWVALNGEIYNHNELREELRSLGHDFRTRSDTEVIAQSYEEWGPECFNRLNGMFAVTVWDSTKRTLNLARDRVGIKPCYYARVNGNVLFASEVKAILASGLLGKRTVNLRMVEQLLEVGYPLEAETLLNEVHQIPPAHRVELSADKFEVFQFWEAPEIRDFLPDKDAVKKTVQNAIVHQTITSDVPVGAFLSGGLDTSTIVAFASQVRADGLKTFCMGFGESTDEFADARVVAETFGTDHHEILVDASDAMKIFPQMVWHSELPKVNLYSWFVNEAASKHVKVCLSGLGGDELFAGYAGTARFRNARRIARWRRLSPILTLAASSQLLPARYAGLARSMRSEPLAYSTLITGFPGDEVSPSVKENVARYFEQDYGFEQGVVGAEFHTKLPYDYLLVEDAMSMAHTLEVRVPLLDNTLLDLLLPVRYEHQMRGQTGKLLLRSAVKDLLPARCLKKPKWGFSVNVYSWWKKGLADYVRREVPGSEFLKEHSGKMFEKVIDQIGKPDDEARTRWYAIAWTMLGLEAWRRMYATDEPPKQVYW
jgi:asparagine synthase (glutamine-hydrolysing)